MVAQKGKDLLLKIKSEEEGFITVAGLRARQVSFNAQTVDTTDSESVGRWRELLAGAGSKRSSITGSGIFKDAESDAKVRSVFFGSSIVTWQIIIPDFGIAEGQYQIVSLEYGGQHDGEVTFDIALESAGEITFTDAS